MRIAIRTPKICGLPANPQARLPISCSVAEAKAIDNKAVVRGFIEQVINTGNLEAMAEFVAEDIIDHNLASDAPQGLEVYREHLAAVYQTYGNFRLTIQRQIAEADLVVTQVTVTGTHQNEWLGLKPSGKQITLTGINIDRVMGGKIVEHWGEANTLGALFQMGAKIVPNQE